MNFLRTRVPLTDAEYHELSGLQGRHAYLTDKHTLIDRFLRIDLGVAFDVEGLLRSRSCKTTLSPESRQERCDRSVYATPQWCIVGFENNPVGALQNRALNIIEEPANGDIFPVVGVPSEGPSSPDPDAVGPHGPDAVDSNRVQDGLIGPCNYRLKVGSTTDRFVRWRFPCTSLRVVPSPYAGDVSTWRHG